MPTQLLLLAALTASLSGCLFGPRELGEIDSHPNVLLTRSPQKIALELAPSVPEKMQVPGDPSFIGLDVDRWHESLSRGFHNGIATFFGNDAPAYKLVLLRADPQLISDGTSPGYGYGARSATALIRYQAELLDAQGKTIATFAGTAVSPQHVTDFDGTPLAMTHAIDEMYERIADKIPANLTAPSPQATNAAFCQKLMADQIALNARTAQTSASNPPTAALDASYRAAQRICEGLVKQTSSTVAQ